MEQRPINSNGKMLENPVTVNPYDKGYKSGAQTSLFIGPIWVEEALSVNIRTQSNDIPVYGYSEVHFDRLMLGKYSISGQIGIAYTESDYLLRIIEMAKNTSIQDGELQKLIEGRKSIFLDSVKYKLITEKLLDTGKFSFSEQKLTEYATNYVERITREIETTGYNEGSPPNTFELTMITGDIHGSNQSIEIYEGVKIIATGKVLVNNDQDIVEMYEFIGKKKPDRTRNIAVASKTYSFYRPNLMKLAGQVATKLVDKLLSPPSINISGTDFRTSKLITTDKVAIAGFLPALPRMYGKSSTFTEIVYSVEYDKLYTDYTEDNKSKPIESTDIVQVVEAGGIEPVDQPSTKLTYPELSSGFNNTYGKLIQPDRYNLSKYVTAVAPIEVADLTEYVGGSVVMPRFAEKEWGIGSYFPPKLVDTELFTYNDSQLANLTSGTLWCNTMGFRSSASNENTELADEGYIKEIAQPYNTMCIVDKVFVDEDYASGDTYTLNISAPVMLDYYNIKESTSKQLSKIKDPLQIGGIDNTIEFV